MRKVAMQDAGSVLRFCTFTKVLYAQGSGCRVFSSCVLCILSQ